MSETATLAAPDAAPVVPSLVDASVEATPPAEAQVQDQPSEQEGENVEKEEQKPRSKASERIGELYGKMKAMERERDAALRDLERLRQPVVDPAKWDQMSYDEQQAAQMRHAVRQERAEELAREARNREADAERVRDEMFMQRLSSAREMIKDIDTVLTDPTLPVTQVGARFIKESEKGPQVAYFLSQNRAEAARIASLEPLAQAYELGRIEQRINAAPTARKVSQAPNPVPKVSGGANPGAKDPANMSPSDMAEYLRAKGLVR